MSQQTPNYTFALIVVFIVCFLIGFITTMNNSMIAFCSEAFNLSAQQGQYVNSAFYGAYLGNSYPRPCRRWYWIRNQLFRYLCSNLCFSQRLCCIPELYVSCCYGCRHAPECGKSLCDGVRTS